MPFCRKILNAVLHTPLLPLTSCNLPNIVPYPFIKTLALKVLIYGFMYHSSQWRVGLVC